MTQINNVDIQELERQVAIAAKPFQALIAEMQRVIVGQHDLLEGLVIGLLGNGHILIEGVPGLAKQPRSARWPRPSRRIFSVFNSRQIYCRPI